MGGYYLMHRGWLDHPALGGEREEFCRRAAWAWMIEEAGFEPRQARIGGKIVDLGRGQFSHSLRYMAGKWGWGHERCRRFLAALRECVMIETTTETGQIIVTICNYDKYQVCAENRETGRETRARQQRDSSETRIKEGKEGKEGESPPPIVPPHPGGDDENATRRRQAERIKPEWLPNAEGRSFAESLGLDPEWYADEFRDYWLAESGPKAVKRDWDRAFKNRCRTLAEQGRGRNAGPMANGHHKPSPGEKLYLGAMRAAAKLDELDSQSGNRGPGESPVVPLLDRRRSAGH